jgi:hypothetical protein
MCSEQCRALVAQMNELLDGDSQDRVTQACHSHLETCERCACLVQTLKKAIELYRCCDPPPIPADLHARIWWAVFAAQHRN